ncbi:MAG: pseudouridine-5'-phosphate glycosidase [Chloroflexi bacterium]|nr:pseudouridine-5'-phosphate glycosidase [Chloroflexota bacterium]
MEVWEIAPKVKEALAQKQPAVALESAFLSHGLPRPLNLETAAAMEEAIQKEGVIPATIGFVSGKAKLGLSNEELELLALGQDVHKISTRDLAIATAQGWTGGTTVSASVYIAHRAGIDILATGGIGGIHIGGQDVSPDLATLAETPILVVCSGAKSILDLSATREWLEAHSIPVIGYNTSEFPGFYSRHIGLSVDIGVDSPHQVAEIMHHHQRLGLPSAILVTVPVPEPEEVPRDVIQSAVEKGSAEAKARGISGPALTPFLLARLGELTAGATTRANVALLKENSRVAAQIAKAWVEK